MSRTVPEDSLLSEHSQNNVSLGAGAPVNGHLGELLMVQTWILYSLEPSLHFGSFLKVKLGRIVVEDMVDQGRQNS